METSINVISNMSTTPNPTPEINSAGFYPSFKPENNSSRNRFTSQVFLLLWKRYRECLKDKWDLMKAVVPALLFFAIVHLLYYNFKISSNGILEVFLVPLGFITFVQRLVIQIMSEKHSKLQGKN